MRSDTASLPMLCYRANCVYLPGDLQVVYRPCTVVSRLTLSVVEKTNGVKKPFSTSLTRSPYCLFFASTCFCNRALMLVLRLLGALGWMILTSKNALCCRPQNLMVFISTRASSRLFEEARRKDKLTVYMAGSRMLSYPRQNFLKMTTPK